MKWIDFKNKYNNASDEEKIRMLEDDDLSDINILRYFLDPSNFDKHTKEEIYDALCVFTASYLDERMNLINLENAIENIAGLEACDQICAAAVSDNPNERVNKILQVEDTKKKAETALKMIDELWG